jgi:hypothetical protein
MLDEFVLKAYRHHRREMTHSGYRSVTDRFSAKKALEYARNEQARVAAGEKAWTPSYVPTDIWPDSKPDRNPAADIGRWYEDPESLGFRFVGSSGAIGGKQHWRRGFDAWYVDSFQDATTRGVVYRLPSRNGLTTYYHGYSDPHNAKDDGSGPCFLVKGGSYPSPDEDSALENALSEACFANSMAEHFAEECRDYDESWRAGLDARSLAREARESGKAWIAALRELKLKKNLICNLRLSRNVSFASYGLSPDFAHKAIKNEVKLSRALKAKAKILQAGYESKREEMINAFDDQPSRHWQRNLLSAWRDGYASY